MTQKAGSLQAGRDSDSACVTSQLLKKFSTTWFAVFSTCWIQIERFRLFARNRGNLLRIVLFFSRLFVAPPSVEAYKAWQSRSCWALRFRSRRNSQAVCLLCFSFSLCVWPTDATFTSVAASYQPLTSLQYNLPSWLSAPSLSLTHNSARRGSMFSSNEASWILQGPTAAVKLLC